MPEFNVTFMLQLARHRNGFGTPWVDGVQHNGSDGAPYTTRRFIPDAVSVREALPENLRPAFDRSPKIWTWDHRTETVAMNVYDRQDRPLNRIVAFPRRRMIN
jgi:hypothetical protein